VLTTLNQCRLNSEVSVLRGGKVGILEGGHIEAPDIQAVLHDSVAYILLGGASLIVQARQQTGSWSLVEASASTSPVPENVFTCSIDHGAKPDSASYAYRLVPEASSADLPALAENASVKVLANNPELQAVQNSPDGLTQVIFHTPGTLDLPEGGRLSVDTACAIQLRAAGDTTTLTVAEPTQELPQLTLTLDWPGRILPACRKGHANRRRPS
jgi:hypothetical protein